MAGRSIGPVQGTPSGLLSLLQLKQLGRNPSAFSDEIVPVFDLQAWYRASQLEYLTGTQFTVAAAATQNYYFGLTVPANEVWFVHSIHCRANLIAGEAINMAIGFAFDRALSQPPLHIFSNQVDRGTLTLPCVWALGCQPQMFFPANHIFGVNVYQITTAATVEVDSEICITRMKAG